MNSLKLFFQYKNAGLKKLAFFIPNSLKKNKKTIYK